MGNFPIFSLDKTSLIRGSIKLNKTEDHQLLMIQLRRNIYSLNTTESEIRGYTHMKIVTVLANLAAWLSFLEVRPSTLSKQLSETSTGRTTSKIGHFVPILQRSSVI